MPELLEHFWIVLAFRYSDLGLREERSRQDAGRNRNARTSAHQQFLKRGNLGGESVLAICKGGFMDRGG